MIGYILTLGVITAGLVAILTSPLWGPWYERHAIRDRVLDRLEQEWTREDVWTDIDDEMRREQR